MPKCARKLTRKLREKRRVDTKRLKYAITVSKDKVDILGNSTFRLSMVYSNDFYIFRPVFPILETP